jgi:hypothetical protein
MTQPSSRQAFLTMGTFLELGSEDAGRLKAFLPRIEDRLPAITDRFYALLGREEQLAHFLEGKLDALKRTHLEWLRELFSGEYGEPFFERQFTVGKVHVRIALDSLWVDAVMDVLRRDLLASILEVADSNEEALAVFGSLVKVMDLALMVINFAYNEHRLQLIHQVTGMPEALLERLIRVGVGGVKG